VDDYYLCKLSHILFYINQIIEGLKKVKIYSLIILMPLIVGNVAFSASPYSLGVSASLTQPVGSFQNSSVRGWGAHVEGLYQDQGKLVYLLNGGVSVMGKKTILIAETRYLIRNAFVGIKYFFAGTAQASFFAKGAAGLSLIHEKLSGYGHFPDGIQTRYKTGGMGSVGYHLANGELGLELASFDLIHPQEFATLALSFTYLFPL
jgi:hypothetical protein